MCIAIASPKDKVIPKKFLQQGYRNNPHGGGFAYVHNGKVIVSKGYFSFRSFWRNFRSHASKCCIVHFRYATHGKTNQENCHPFEVIKDKMAFIHNGQIHSMPKNENFSDTYIFNNSVLKPMFKDESVITQKPFIFLMEQAIGTGSKLVFINNKEEISIANESAGEWLEGNWYSNCTYKQPRQTYARSGFYTTEYYTGGGHYSQPKALPGPQGVGVVKKNDQDDDDSGYIEFLEMVCEDYLLSEGVNDSAFGEEEDGFLTEEEMRDIEKSGIEIAQYGEGFPEISNYY